MIIRIYDYLKTHARVRWTSLIILTAMLTALVAQLSYKEDISDFLPLGTEDRKALDIYQDIAGANKLVILFASHGDADSVTAAIDRFQEAVQHRDTAGWTAEMQCTFDMDDVTAVQDFVYDNIPLFLTRDDYIRMDSLLSQPHYVSHQLAVDKEMLLFPSGGLLSDNIGRDPLNLFTPVVARLRAQQADYGFEIYNGYVFTPDMQKAVVTLSSPFGNAETERNAQLLTLLEEAIDTMHTAYPTIEAHVMGGPQIAVGNARQIKQDSIVAVALSAVLIVLLFIFSFRSARNIILIALSIGWGWLFALGGMALFHDSVSIIVIGISSVILGIAINYPLHLVAHVGHEPDTRKALKDIFLPLLVGNITTVGAFLALVPLQATALRDLGTFASLLLIGTIAFVLIYMPHHVRPVRETSSGLLYRIAMLRPENNRWIVAAVVVLTAVFGWFSMDVEFDSNMANINYMTPEQRADMEYFQRLTATDTTVTTEALYVPSSATTMQAALDSAEARRLDMTAHFLSSRKEQERRLTLWRDFCARHASLFATTLPAEAQKAGFAADAFAPFAHILRGSYSPQDYDYFSPLTTTVFASNVSIDREAGRYTIVDKLMVKPEEMEQWRSRYPGSFDVKSMNGAMANTLSDNFNYIGFACSAIVFLFLWGSFRSLRLAIISFVPMAISWLWILGIMALLGIKFNIVNIILATFIFGQGDDYTIFITEGCMKERQTGRGVLTSYKQSILLSAIIMFIGIGTLIFAKHPALFSLAEVTVVGMSCVVFMSWMIPPLLFNITDKIKKLR